jgi:hypothetical protein
MTVEWIDADHIIPLAKLELPGPATMDLDHLCWVDRADHLRGQIDQASIRLVVPARFVERGLSSRSGNVHDRTCYHFWI